MRGVKKPGEKSKYPTEFPYLVEDALGRVVMMIGDRTGVYLFGTSDNGKQIDIIPEGYIKMGFEMFTGSIELSNGD